MRGPTSPSARRTLSLWWDADRRTRLHVGVRWRTAPFAALELEVPLAGDILEIGCGHGLFSTYLAISSTGRRVLGVDIDRDKIDLARHAAGHLVSGEADVRFEHSPTGEVPTTPGGWRAIVFADVLYLLARPAREALLAECVAALAPGGMLIVKEVDTSPKLKARLAQFQELLATRVLRITAGEDLDFPSSAELETFLRTLGLTTMAKRIDHGYLHPHCVVLGTAPGGS